MSSTKQYLELVQFLC